MAIDIDQVRDMVRAAPPGQAVERHPMHPKTRADCERGFRPCPWVGCRYHLFLNVTARGSLQYPFGRDLDELARMPHTCALDSADDDPASFVALADAFRMTTAGLRLAFDKAVARLLAGPLSNDGPDGRVSDVAWTHGRRRRRRPHLGGFIDSA